MANKVAKEAIWLTADDQPVKAGDARAACLLVAAGLELSDDEIAQYKVGKLVADPAEAYDAVADHEAKHGGETPEQAAQARQRMLDGESDPDGPPAEGEHGNLDDESKAAKARPNKAAKAPENKSE